MRRTRLQNRCLGVVTVGIGASLGILAWFHGRKPAVPETYVSRPRGEVTFNKDIAPILFHHCAGCHRPDQSAPFSLLTYRDAKKHDRQIAEVVERRYMPPWLPERGYGEFEGERRLSEDEIETVLRWVGQGAVEGEPRDLPPVPKWEGGWQLGEPDLVVTLPQSYTLPADGKDTYRNFVVPIPMASRRYVRAMEFQPGLPRGVHHAFMRFDSTRHSRDLDGQDSEPGFPGMDTPASAFSPASQFLSWQPGKTPSFGSDGASWALETNVDLVLQLHMQSVGKPELVRPSVAFYFTDRPPNQTFFKVRLVSFAIDIPAGETNYVVQDEYMLPVDAEALGVLPHAHYLCKEMQGVATLPNGTRQPLLLIKQWDFNWQGDYQYAKPVPLPKGTRLAMRYTYDNSTGNPRNPRQPPVRVRYGLETTDEMAELWLRLRLRNGHDLTVMRQDYQVKAARENAIFYEYRLRLNPNDAKALSRLGEQMLFLGKPEEALKHLRRAVQLDDRDDEAHYFLGVLLRTRKQLAEAKAELERALQINPANYKAYGNLGVIYFQEGDLDRAESCFRSALQINPDDSLARANLADIARAKTRQKQR